MWSTKKCTTSTSTRDGQNLYEDRDGAIDSGRTKAPRMKHWSISSLPNLDEVAAAVMEVAAAGDIKWG